MSNSIASINQIFTNKWSLLIEVGLFALVLLTPRFFTQENYMIRRYLYIGVLGLLILIVRFTGLSKEKLGLQATNWIQALKTLILPTALFCLGLVAIKVFLPNLFDFGFRDTSPWWVTFKILTYVAISVPMQELVFRGYSITRLEQLTSNKWIIVAMSAIIFGVSHVPFKIGFITFGSMFLGVVYSLHFLRYRSLYPLMLSHGVIGMVLILFINT